MLYKTKLQAVFILEHYYLAVHLSHRKSQLKFVPTQNRNTACSILQTRNFYILAWKWLLLIEITCLLITQ